MPVVGSTTPNNGLDVRSVWLWPQLGQYCEVSGTSELQYQQVVMGADSRLRPRRSLLANLLGGPRELQAQASEFVGLKDWGRITSMTDQGELFPIPAGSEPKAPLATRMRPK